MPMNPFATLLPKILKWTEIASLAVILVAILLKAMHYQGAPDMLMIGFTTLAATYFLSAYTIVQLPIETSDKQKGFADLLPTILRKLMYIGLAVYCVARLFTFLHYPGANEMMLIGGLTIVGGTAISLLLVLTKRERMAMLQAPLIRCVGAIALYFIIPYFK